jgi:hypothetical protein
MPELYIGNISKQVQHFCYRSLERAGIIMQPIPIGGQIRVSPTGSKSDLTTPEIDYILEQYGKYGMLPVDEIDAKQSPFSGLCYSIGKQISPERLKKAMFKKEESLQKFGANIRKEAAIATNNQIEQQIGAPLRNLEMSFEEIEPRGGYADDADHLSEGVRVTRADRR